MNNYKIKIIPDNGKFVGYALQNEEVIFFTVPCSSSILATKRLTELIEKKHPAQTTTNLTVSKQVSSPATRNSVSSTSVVKTVSPKKCCGRG